MVTISKVTDRWQLGTVTHHSEAQLGSAGGFRAFGANPPYELDNLIRRIRDAEGVARLLVQSEAST